MVAGISLLLLILALTTEAYDHGIVSGTQLTISPMTRILSAQRTAQAPPSPLT
jgi:hypothetical protein